MTCPQTVPPATAQIYGRIHSVETGSTVDGPGIRYVVFTQGCRLRCQYCHNPDTWDLEGGRRVSVDEIVADIESYRSYLTYSGGGVTFTGGEPLLQPEFVAAVASRCRQQGLHVAIDTSGFPDWLRSQSAIHAADLILLDIKSSDPDTYHRVTGVSIAPTLAFARHLSELQKPMWIRFVLAPGLTDDPENIAGLARFVATLQGVEKVEVLPFHQMGAYKWQELGIPYLLKDTPPATPEQAEAARQIFRRHGLRAE